MTDEHTPQSEQIDAAIRQAERQLEEKMQALRMSALGESSEQDVNDVPDDVALLRPTGGSSSASSSRASSDVTLSQPNTPSDMGDSVEVPTEWSYEPAASFDNDAEADDGADEDSPLQAAGISDLTPEWSDEPSRNYRDRDRDRAPSSPNTVESVPTEEEMQFWAHTRTALRNLQQVSDNLPTKVAGSISDEIERIMRDEMSTSNATMRLLQQNVQQTLPTVASRLEDVLRDEMTAPTDLLKQVQDELPARLDRLSRDVRGTVSEEVERLLNAVRTATQEDVARVEQSVATNVTRMSGELNEGMSRVERGVVGVNEHVDRFDRTIRTEFERIDAGMRAALERTENAVREETSQSSDMLRKIDDELPARFNRVERTVSEQVLSSQRDVSDVLGSLAETTRILLDRVTNVANNQEIERTKRTEDLEFMVDTITTGWEGMASAIKTLYEQGSKNEARLQSLEAKFDRLNDLEASVEQTMTNMTAHIQELQPAPVVVTVNHPDAQVSNTTRGGYLMSSESGEGISQ